VVCLPDSGHGCACGSGANDEQTTFTCPAFTGVLRKHDTTICMDGKGAWRDHQTTAATISPTESAAAAGGTHRGTAKTSSPAGSRH
jgi:hypothetical protein